MNWKRYKLLVVAGAICFVITAALVFWLIRARGQLQSAEQEVQRLRNDQTRLTAGDVFPSEESFTQLQEDLNALEERREAFREAILAGQKTPTTLQGGVARFGDYVRNAFIPVLLEAAGAARQGGDRGVLIRDPSFGQQRFIDGELPEAEVLPELLLKLELMRHLSLTMFDAGISELVFIQPRVETEAETRRPGTRPRTPAGTPFAAQDARPTAGPARQEAPEDSGVNAKRAELFETVTFQVRIKVYEDFFWTLMNRFAADDNQLVVQNLRITLDNELLWPTYLQPPEGRAPTRRTPARAPRGGRDDIAARLAEAEGIPTAGTGTAEPVAPVAGLGERRQKRTGGDLLDVSFDVIVYRLKPVQGS